MDNTEKQRRMANMDVLDSLSMDELKKKNKKKFEETGEFPAPIEEKGYAAPNTPTVLDLDAPYKKVLKPEGTPMEIEEAKARLIELMEKPEKADSDLKELDMLKKRIEDEEATTIPEQISGVE